MLMTEREPSDDMMESMVTPLVGDYWTSGDMIVNNTIIIDDDGVSNDAPVLGVALMQSSGAIFKNNAIAHLDRDVSDNCMASAALGYLGVMPNTTGGLVSDRNAYELAMPQEGSLFRFIETDDESEILDLGGFADLQTIQQWQMWTGEDINSAVGNFTDDLRYFDNGNMTNLRVNMIPRAPLGSILNNRGERIEEVSEDVDGNVRGAAGQPYDIGAFEFDGRMRIQDIEVVAITDPGSYKSGSGDFSGEEHVMTYAPVEVTARLRNNRQPVHVGHRSSS
jgi:hypothetical protein